NGIRQPVVRIAEIANEGATVAVLGSVALASGPGTVGNAGLYLYADKLVAGAGPQAISYIGPAWSSPYAWTRGVTYVEVMSTSSSALPVTRWRAEIERSIVARR